MHVALDRTVVVRQSRRRSLVLTSKPPSFQADHFLAWAVPLCSFAAVVTVLAHAFHPGIDLPMHMYVISALSRLVRGDADFAAFYRLSLGTPYLLVYLCAVPLVPLFGASWAVKAVLACSAGAAPWAMTTWLRSIRGEPLLGVFGALLVFGFPYQWGFISHVAAIPLVFLYLAAFERQGLAPTPRMAAVAFAFCAALLLCHGISFGLTMLIIGLRALSPFRPRMILARTAHAIPVAGAAAAWLALHRGRAVMFFDWPSAKTRLIWLFSSPFRPEPNPNWAWLGVAVLAIGLAIGLPRPGKNAAQWVPLALSLALYATLPEWIAETWLVGTRFCAYVHAFLPGVFAPGRDPRHRIRLATVALAVTLVGLGFHNARLSGFVNEMKGLTRLAEHVPPRADIRTSLPVPESSSETFGMAQHRYAGAYLAVRNGGILDEEFSKALQMPLQRRESPPFPTEFRVLVDSGDLGRATERARTLMDTARLVAREGSWLLFVGDERTFAGGALSIIRWSQTWGKPEVNRSVTGAPLVVAGTTYATGLGVHATSYIRVRVKRSGRLSGAVGLDARAWPSARIRFEIRTPPGRVLFRTRPISKGDRPVPFSVPVEPEEGLVLEATLASALEGAHADWLGLTFEEAR